jgi:hypothetical protein
MTPTNFEHAIGRIPCGRHADARGGGRDPPPPPRTRSARAVTLIVRSRFARAPAGRLAQPVLPPRGADRGRDAASRQGCGRWRVRKRGWDGHAANKACRSRAGGADIGVAARCLAFPIGSCACRASRHAIHRIAMLHAGIAGKIVNILKQIVTNALLSTPGCDGRSKRFWRLKQIFDGYHPARAAKRPPPCTTISSSPTSCAFWPNWT